jgi:hypothetical protein
MDWLTLLLNSFKKLIKPTTDSASDATIADVIGIKADTAAGTSLISLSKQAVVKTTAIDGKVDAIKTNTDTIPAITAKLIKPTADSANDSTIADVLGIKADTIAGTSIVSLLKNTLSKLVQPTTDSANDSTIADVIGIKADTVAGTSLIALSKQVIAKLAKPTTDSASDSTIADVIGNKSDTVAGTSIISLLKKVVTDTAICTSPKVTTALITENLFTVSGGPVEIVCLIGMIKTTLEGGVYNVKLVHTPTGYAAVDLCTVASISGGAVGKFIYITRLPADGIKLSPAAGLFTNAITTKLVVLDGILSVNTSVNKTGAIDWYVHYKPLTPDATVTPI